MRSTWISSSQGRVFMKILIFYRISSSQITHYKTHIKTPAPFMAGDPLFFSILLGKKNFPPPRHVLAGLAGCAGWLGWLVGWVGWLAGLAGLAGWLGWLVGRYGRYGRYGYLISIYTDIIHIYIVYVYIYIYTY